MRQGPKCALSEGRGTPERFGLRVADPITVERLRSHLPNQSKECVMEMLGISAQTWTKLKRGQPVRGILIERAMQRVEKISS